MKAGRHRPGATSDSATANTETGTVWHDQTREEDVLHMQFLRKDAGGAGRAEGWVLKSLRVHRRQIQRHEDLADRLGRQSGGVALAWVRAQPAATAPIICSRTQEQLDAALRALYVEVDEPTLIRLHEVVPGRRTAREDCGW